MNRLGELWRRLQYLLHRRQLEEDLAEEMRLHRELRAAAQQPERRFGNVTLLREESRAVWISAFWETLAQDLRYGVRALAANPGFTAAAVLSLALGIGANSAIFNILNAVMLRSLPVKDPKQLVELREGNGAYFTNPIWEQVRDHQTAFSETLAYGTARFDLANGGESRFAHGLWVSEDFFRVLGVNAWRGRLFTPEDDRHGGGRFGPVAVISHAFWESHFGGDPAAIGKTISLDRHTFEIVGVAPPWFRGLDVDQTFDVAIPIGCESILHTDLSALTHRSWWWLRIVARLPAGKALEPAQAQLNSIAPEINRATLPANWTSLTRQRFLSRWFNLRPASVGFSETVGRYRTGLFTLMAVAGLVLLIACANIANLLLARAVARQREISVRLAIGATRRRLIRQLLTESLLLSSAGAAAGLLFALWGSKLLVHLLSTKAADIQPDLSLDGHLLAFTAAIAVLTGVLFGLAPAFRAASAAPNQILKESGGAASSGWSRFSLNKALVAVQIGLSLALLVGAGLFLGTLHNLLAVDAGFNRRNLLIVSATLPAASIQKELRVPLYKEIVESLRRIPGVSSAAISKLVPIGRGGWNDVVIPQGYRRNSDPDDTLVFFNEVSPGYFETMQTPILMGRDFSDRDDLHAPKVMVVSETTARHFWGAANPIGKTIALDHRSFGSPIPEVYEVIGLVKDAKYRRLDEQPLNTAFVAVNQDADPQAAIRFEVRSNLPFASLIPEIRSAIGRIRQSISLEFSNFETQVDDSLLQQRLLALLSSFFGLLALLLAAIGLYGVVSYGTSRRQSEIGIRVALGAKPASVVWLVLRDVVLLFSLGAIGGLAISISSGRLLNSLVYGVPAYDPATLTGALAVLALAAAIAGYLPARRAARMDPIAALRNE